MAHRAAINVLASVNAPGTAAFGAQTVIAGFRNFANIGGLTTADTAVIHAKEVDANNNPTGKYETVLATRNASGGWDRTTVLRSSNADAVENFTATTLLMVPPECAAVLSPPQLTGTVNDYQPESAAAWRDAALAGHTLVLLTSDALYRSITGLVGYYPGQRVTFYNQGDYPIDFARQNANSAAANRFSIPKQLTIWPEESITFVYSGTRWCSQSKLASANDADALDFADDFIWGSVETGEFGYLNWSASGNLGTHVQVASTASNTGIIRVVSGATSGNNARVHPGNAANISSYLFSMHRLFSIVHRSTDRSTSVHRIGVGQDLSSTTFGTDGIWLESTNAGNWLYQARRAGAMFSASPTDTTVAAVVNNWYKFDFYRRPSDGQWEIYINNVRYATISAANGPTDNVGAVPGTFLSISAASARSIDIDYARVRIFNPNQRWT